MIEKRRAKRLPILLDLQISSLFKQDNILVENINAPIEVVDVSKEGIGFTSKSILPLHYYFNAKIALGSETATLNCVVQIVRIQQMPNGDTMYGCEIVGTASIMDYLFDEYEEILD